MRPGNKVKNSPLHVSTSLKRAKRKHALELFFFRQTKFDAPWLHICLKTNTRTWIVWNTDFRIMFYAFYLEASWVAWTWLGCFYPCFVMRQFFNRMKSNHFRDRKKIHNLLLLQWKCKQQAQPFKNYDRSGSLCSIPPCSFKKCCLTWWQ